MGSLNVSRWEQRWHPLREEWVIVAAHRQDRPWHGETAGESIAIRDRCTSRNAICVRATRALAAPETKIIHGIFVFDNDHPCVGRMRRWTSSFRRVSIGTALPGCARVLCYSPNHNLTLAELRVDEIENLLDAWRDQYENSVAVRRSVMS